MKSFVALCLALSLITPLVVGCEKSSQTKTETKSTGPGGSTTVTDTETVKQSGDNPPPANR